jgi:manganese/zinc/iron transport system substrate-binding protein
LNNEVIEVLTEIPRERRILLTAHDAFAYFGRAYDIEVRGLQGISTSTEYGLKDIEDAVDLILERGIKAVFVESSVSPKALKAVVERCQSKGHAVSIGGELFADSMGDTDSPEGTYIGMVRHNIHTIVSALK